VTTVAWPPWLLLAEEYEPRTRRMLGNFPQAMSHMALINTGPTSQTRGGVGQVEAGDDGFREPLALERHLTYTVRQGPRVARYRLPRDANEAIAATIVSGSTGFGR
jgi:hypothetical protein